MKEKKILQISNKITIIFFHQYQDENVTKNYNFTARWSHWKSISIIKYVSRYCRSQVVVKKFIHKQPYSCERKIVLGYTMYETREPTFTVTLSIEHSAWKAGNIANKIHLHVRISCKNTRRWTVSVNSSFFSFASKFAILISNPQFLHTWSHINGSSEAESNLHKC